MKKRCIALMLIAAMSINGMTALAVEKAESKDNSVSAAYVKTAVYEDGWYHDNTSNSWYYYVDGEYVTGWKYVDGYWYYFNASGVMQKGWKKVDGYWYYFNQNGCMITGWKNVEGYWYYFNQNGCMITGWKNVDGYWYYFNQNGCMISGWKHVDGYWYYFNRAGVMQTGWEKVDGYWYYFNRAGVMQTGWEKVDGYWYYFNRAGVMQTSRWIDNTYYVNSNGVMLTSTMTPDGYWVDSYGKYDFLIGTWEVDSRMTMTVNNASMREIYGSAFSHYGSEMRFYPDGKFSYGVGAGNGGEGRYYRGGNTASYWIHRYEDEVLEEDTLSIVYTDNGSPRVVMNYFHYKIYWEKISNELKEW